MLRSLRSIAIAISFVLLYPICDRSQGLPEVKVLDEYSLQCPNKDAFTSPLIKGKYEENEIVIVFYDLSREETIFNAMLGLERSLTEAICNSCIPLSSKKAPSIDDSVCKGFLSAMASIGYNNKVCYYIIIHFPLQDDSAVKSLRKVIKDNIISCLAANKIDCQYDIDYSKRKVKINKEM